MQKICPKCKENKTLDQYNWYNKKHTKLQSWCKMCMKELQKATYKTEKGKKVFDESKQNIKQQKQSKLNDYLEKNPCIDCGTTDIRVLQFDHVRDEKVLSISAMLARHFAWSKIEEEIKKCEIRCANCHHIKTAKQGNYSNSKYLEHNN